jgi:membrane-bound metal-dependent hydrolase YbcI (DUF457 family)
MFAIGHFALGYLAGKGSSKLLSVKLNLPLLLVASVVPDVDLILQFVNPMLFMHRGPSHAILSFTALLIPFFILYGKRAIPYYIALLSHSLIGDLFTGGIELFWPLSQGWFGFENIDVASIVPVSTEIILFTAALAAMFWRKDFQSILRSGKYNWTLFVAFGAVLGPMLRVSAGLEGSLPALLFVPSLFCLILFGYSLVIQLRHWLRCRSPFFSSRETKNY